METDFRKWMDTLDFNGKEVTKAGEAVGIGSTASKERYRGERDLTFTERLAMAALAAGLPAWHPSTAEEIRASRRILDSVRDAVPVLSMKWMDDSTEHQIPAE